MPSYTDTQGYNDIYKQILGNKGPNGYDWNDANTNSKLQQMGQQFSGMFQNALGRAPTDQEMSAMYSNIGGQVYSSPAGYSGTGYSELQNLFNPYIQNTYGAEEKANQAAQSTQTLNQSSDLVQNLVNRTMGNTAAQFSDPNSQVYQKFSGMMNNLGITPSSGAFQAGAGSTIAGAGVDAANMGLESVGFPQISGIAGMQNAPYQMSLENMYPGLSSYGQRNNDIMDFNMQSDLARELSSGGGMSGFQQAMAGVNTAANVGQGVAAFRKPTWICTAMWNAKVLAACEIDRLHNHLFKVFLGRIWKFLGYFALAKIVVWQAERSGVVWQDWRPLFYDRVIAESDSRKALDLYENAFWRLTRWAFSISSTQPATIS